MSFQQLTYSHRAQQQTLKVGPVQAVQADAQQDAAARLLALTGAQVRREKPTLRCRAAILFQAGPWSGAWCTQRVNACRALSAPLAPLSCPIVSSDTSAWGPTSSWSEPACWPLVAGSAASSVLLVSWCLVEEGLFGVSLARLTSQWPSANQPSACSGLTASASSQCWDACTKWDPQP